jgi:hypothetical protein
MNGTVFPVQYYPDGSDEFLVRYYEILHIVGMTIGDMATKMSCSRCSEELYARPGVMETEKKTEHTNKRIYTDVEESQSYRRLLQTSDVLFDSFRTISQCELVVLRTCSFMLLLCLIHDYKSTSTMLDSIFEDDDEWTYFSGKKNIEQMISSIPTENLQLVLKRICTTEQTNKWMEAMIDDWIDVCGKNISSFLQLNTLPGGKKIGSQRYTCVVTSGPDKHYVGSIQILSHEDRPECMVMGIVKHPFAEKECNNMAIYAGFVRTIFDTVAQSMKSIGKAIIWAFPLQNMAGIMEKSYGKTDQKLSKYIVSRFLLAMGLHANEVKSIIGHPHGLFVYTCNNLIR